MEGVKVFQIVLTDNTHGLLSESDRERASTLEFFASFDQRDIPSRASLLNLHGLTVTELSVMEQGPEGARAAHSSAFESYFPDLMRALDPTSRTLTLWLHGVDRRYFDEFRFIDEVLNPRRLKF